ncbi:hypothetical protein pb186bvf_018950 [Paramecium bursaria]
MKIQVQPKHIALFYDIQNFQHPKSYYYFIKLIIKIYKNFNKLQNDARYKNYNHIPLLDIQILQDNHVEINCC